MNEEYDKSKRRSFTDAWMILTLMFNFYSNKKVDSTSHSESRAVRKPCESRVSLLIPVNKVDFLEFDVQNIRLRQRTRGEAPMRACRQAGHGRVPVRGRGQASLRGRGWSLVRGHERALVMGRGQAPLRGLGRARVRVQGQALLRGRGRARACGQAPLRGRPWAPVQGRARAPVQGRGRASLQGQAPEMDETSACPEVNGASSSSSSSSSQTAGVSQNVSTAGESNVHAPVLSGGNYHGPVTMNFTTTPKT